MLKIKEEREKILDRELLRHIDIVAKLEVEIAYQETLDPSEMSAKKAAKIGANGEALSWTTISRKEHIELLNEKLETEQKIVGIITELIKK